MAGRARGPRTRALPALVVGPASVAAALTGALLLLPPGRADAEGRAGGGQPVSAGGSEDGPRQPSLVEAAHRNRERIARSRRRGASAPRFDDAALAAARAFSGAGPGPAESSAPRSAAAAAGQRNGEEPPEGAGSPELPDGPGIPEPASPGETSAAERAAAQREQERALRERLLELEWSLAAVGASGLPYAPRNPNRAVSPLDAGRFRARQEEIRRELAALAEEAAAERPPQPQ